EQHVQRAGLVHLVCHDRLVHRSLDRRDRGVMQHAIDALDGAATGVQVRDAAADEAYLTSHRREVRPATGRQVVQHRDVVSRSDEVLHQVRADEARTPSDQIAHVISLGSAWSLPLQESGQRVRTPVAPPCPGAGRRLDCGANATGVSRRIPRVLQPSLVAGGGAHDTWFTFSHNGGATGSAAGVLVRGPDQSGVATLHAIRRQWETTDFDCNRSGRLRWARRAQATPRGRHAWGHVATLSRARGSRNATRLSTTDPLLGAPLCGTPVARRAWRTTAPSTRPS